MQRPRMLLVGVGFSFPGFCPPTPTPIAAAAATSVVGFHPEVVVIIFHEGVSGCQHFDHEVYDILFLETSERSHLFIFP